MIDDLKKNIETELKITEEISANMGRLDIAADGTEDKMINETIETLISSVKIINDSVPKLLSNISLARELPSETIETKKESVPLEKINFEHSGSESEVTINPKDRKAFLKNLSIREDLFKKMKNKKIVKEEKKDGGFKATRGYLKLSNKYFLETASRLISKGYFRDLSSSLKKSNIDILFQTYIAMIFFTTALSVFVSLLIALFFLFFDVGLAFPIISFYQGSYLSRLMWVILVPILVPMFVYLGLYVYPSTEKKSIKKKIDQELPFAVIYMSSISGSGIEPSQIFRIIAESREYPALRKEIRKVLNQINLYGYDLVTALNNVAKSTSSERLSELFAGLSTTINSGGDLSEFFEKRSETLLIEYRLEREKYSKIAETFMDIYISVVVAAPMILMLLIVMISISGIKIGFSTAQMNIIIIFVIALINVVFLTVLQTKQPKY